MNTTCLNMSIKTVSMLIKTIIFISSSYFSLHFFSRHAYILQVSFALIFFCNVFLQFKCFFYDKQSWFLVHVFLSIFVFCFKRPFLTFDSMCHSRAQTFICFSEIVNLNAHIARVELCILNSVNVTRFATQEWNEMEINCWKYIIFRLIYFRCCWNFCCALLHDMWYWKCFSALHSEFADSFRYRNYLQSHLKHSYSVCLLIWSARDCKAITSH